MGWCSHGGLPAGGKGLTGNLSYSLIITQTSTKPSSAGTRKHSQPPLQRPRLPSLWYETFTAHLHTHAETYAQRGSTPGIRAPCWCRLCSSLDNGPGGLSLSTEKAKKSHCLHSQSSCRMMHTVCNTSGINPLLFMTTPSVNSALQRSRPECTVWLLTWPGVLSRWLSQRTASIRRPDCGQSDTELPPPRPRRGAYPHRLTGPPGLLLPGFRFLFQTFARKRPPASRGACAKTP